MIKDFKYWKSLHESERLEEFSSNSIGLLWLKTKSIIRKELISEFVKQNKLTLNETTMSKQFIELFELFSENPHNAHKLLPN